MRLRCVPAAQRPEERRVDTAGAQLCPRRRDHGPVGAQERVPRQSRRREHRAVPAERDTGAGLVNKAGDRREGAHGVDSLAQHGEDVGQPLPHSRCRGVVAGPRQPEEADMPAARGQQRHGETSLEARGNEALGPAG
jgi:hypothetical protein